MEKAQIFKEWISECNKIVFFGGAGVSTESGIPDFRSKDGLYNQHDVQFDMYPPEYLLSHSCLIQHPKVFYEFQRQKMDTRSIEPNFAHKYLVKLEEEGRLKAIVTQNIDGLHQKAGSRNVFEIHGNALRNYCMKCAKKYPDEYIYESTEAIPHCTCGGAIRPEVTLYEEGLPDDAVEGALEAIAHADMLIIGGTSLTVYPAANFVNYFRGRYLVVINETELNVSKKENTLFVYEKIGAFFKKLTNYNK